jgi:putative ribosome biogenesis GTPase RsgA
MSNEIIEKLLVNVDSQKVNVIHLLWKIESVKQLANGQSDSTTQINIKAVTSIKKNVKIKDIPSTDMYGR